VAGSVQLWELPRGRCVSILPVFLQEGSSAHCWGFVAFFVVLAMDCSAAALVSHRFSNRSQTNCVLPCWFHCCLHISSSSVQSGLTVWVRSEQC